MTDPIDVVSVTAPPPVAPPPAPPERRDPPEARAREPGPHKADPIALDVRRGEDGVFVYTLTDPATGRLVAVIPEGTEERVAGNYASGGWVDLTA